MWSGERGPTYLRSAACKPPAYRVDRKPHHILCTIFPDPIIRLQTARFCGIQGRVADAASEPQPGEALDGLEHRGEVLVAEAAALGREVELARQRGRRDRRAAGRTRLDRDPHVLEHVVEPE